MSDMTDGERSMFETGDQDYGSAVGWNPDKARIQRLLAEDRKKNPRKYAPAPDLLFIREAQHFMEFGTSPAPMRQLFGPFWREGEVAIMFAPPGVGKSVLATQISESLARGIPFAPFEKPAAERIEPQRVLYIDYEQTRNQFAERYTCVSEDGKRREHPYLVGRPVLDHVVTADGRAGGCPRAAGPRPFSCCWRVLRRRTHR